MTSIFKPSDLNDIVVATAASGGEIRLGDFNMVDTNDALWVIKEYLRSGISDDPDIVKQVTAARLAGWIPDLAATVITLQAELNKRS